MYIHVHVPKCKEHQCSCTHSPRTLHCGHLLLVEIHKDYSHCTSCSSIVIIFPDEKTFAIYHREIRRGTEFKGTQTCTWYKRAKDIHFTPTMCIYINIGIHYKGLLTHTHTTNLELVDWPNEVFQTIATRPHSFLVSSNMTYRFLSSYSYNRVPLEAWSISLVHRLFTKRRY